MNAVWFVLGAISTLVVEIVVCIVYGISASNTGGKK